MAWSEKVADEIGDETWYQLAHNMEELTAHHPYFTERKLYPNVEFYSAPLLYTLGFKPDMMPALFGCTRVAGWSAHVLEQLADNRIIRPNAEYIGSEIRDYVTIDRR
jgi:citrate synthase